MSAFLASVLTELPNLAAIGCNWSPVIIAPDGSSTGGQMSCGLMTPDGNGGLDFGGGTLGASETKRFLITITKPALLTIEASNWAPPECDDVVAIPVGVATAFEDRWNGRLPYGSGKDQVGMTLSVVCTGNGWLTITSGRSVWSYNIRQWATNATNVAMGAFVCLRTADDPGAKIVDLDEKDATKATAPVVGPKTTIAKP